MRSRFLCHLAGAMLLGVGATWPATALRADDNPAAPPPGVDVQARGPVHEAYAEPTDVRPEPGPVVPQQPPDPVAEMPPDQKPEGDNVQWIPGYWAWDNEATTFLWVSGFWRTPPPGRTWTPGHWQQVDGGWQWVPGFWAPDDIQEVEYLPPPPPSIDSGPSTPAADETSIYVPGCWVYHETRYLWRPGYWVEANPDWVWVPDHYCWTPAGFVFVTGYWDFPLEGRGLLFAPVRFGRDVLGRRDFVYTPEYVVQPDFLLTALFVRPAWGHYYFGDYFDAGYGREGFTPWVDYRVGRFALDPNFAFYQRRYRDDRWATSLRDLYKLRREGDAPRPPRTWAQQTEIVNKITTNRTANVAINQNINVTNLQVVAALAPIGKAQGVRVTGLGALGGARPDERHVPERTIKLESVPQARRTELGKEANRVHEFAAAQSREQAKLVADGGAPIKPQDRPKAVKVQLPKAPARPPETRPQQPSPAPKPPPPPPSPKHEERPIPPQEPPRPPAPPKTTPPTTPKEPPTTLPKEPPPPPPKEPPAKPPTPPREPPPPPPPSPPKEPPTPPPPPKEPPTPPREPPTTLPKEPPPPPKEPLHQPPPAPVPPREPPPPPPAHQPPPPPPREPPPPPPLRDKPPPPPPKDKDKPPGVGLGA